MSSLSSPKWVRTSGNKIPSNAIKCGYEEDGRVLFVAKAINPEDGQWTPGKAGFHLDGCYFPYGRLEKTSSEYEVLTREPNERIVYEWRNCSSGKFPDKEKAICTSTEAGLYVARGIHDGSLIPGKIADDPIACYVSYGREEFSVHRYDILYQVQITGDIDPDYEEEITKYYPHLHDMGSNLMKGIPLMSKYATNLKAAIDDGKDDVSFIRDVLYPTIKDAKIDFSEMIKTADKIVHMIDTDVEKCEDILHEKNVAIRDREKKLEGLKTELDGKSRDIEDGEREVKRRQGELDKASEALDTAQDKLDDAEEASKTAKIVGGLLFILGPLGWIAGASTLIADATALKKEVELCKETRDTADGELKSSQKRLDKARSEKKYTEYRIKELSRRKDFQKSYLENLNKAVDKLKDYRKKVIDLNIKVKNVDLEVTKFYETVEDVLLETDGGYSLQLLKKPTIKVFDALSKLLQSKSVKIICSISDVAELKTQLKELEQIKWPANTD